MGSFGSESLDEFGASQNTISEYEGDNKLRRWIIVGSIIAILGSKWVIDIFTTP